MYTVISFMFHHLL